MVQKDNTHAAWQRVLDAVAQYREAPFRSADWLAGQLLWITGQLPANDEQIAALTTPNPPASEAGSGEVERLANEAAMRMWRIHPNDLDALGFISDRHGGDYENPRAAYYASEIMSVVRAALATTPSAEG